MQNKEIIAIAEDMQTECHSFIEYIMANKKECTHQDATNIWLFQKLTEFEIRLKNIETFLVI